MLVRLLIAVLMLTGPNPVRVCTCAASDGLPSPSFQTISAADTSPSGKRGCGCRSESHRDTASAATERSNHDLACTRGGHPDSGRHPHHPDCPAVVSPAVLSAIPPPTPDAPTACDVGVPIRSTAAFREPARFVGRLEPGRRIRPVPLYISLLTLLI